MTVPLYDAFSADYDRFVDWPGRLTYELPFIERQLKSVGAKRVLDAACGTGQHAIALAERGFELVGADLSQGMIEQAERNAAAAGVDAHFITAGFGQLTPNTNGDFDALLCLGNSLPHVLTQDELAVSLVDFAAVLRPGGLLLIQSRNFDAVLVGRERWMEPQSHRQGEQEWLFFRFYDYEADGAIQFNIATLAREGDAWSQRVESTRLRPWLQSDLLDGVAAAGFGAPTCFGDMTGAPFTAETSGNLIISAIKE